MVGSRKRLGRLVRGERAAIPLEYLIIATAGLAIAAFVAFQMKRWLCLRSLPQSEQFAVDPSFGCADDLERAIKQCYSLGKGLGRDFTCFAVPMPSSCDDDLFDQKNNDEKSGLPSKIKKDDKSSFQIQTQTEAGLDKAVNDYSKLKDANCHNLQTDEIGSLCQTLYISFDYTGGTPNIILGNSDAQRVPSC